MKEITVAELFAGVGGFRIGLEKASLKYRTIWANQWEPGKKYNMHLNAMTNISVLH